jgi:hypothetical protein
LGYPRWYWRHSGFSSSGRDSSNDPSPVRFHDRQIKTIGFVQLGLSAGSNSPIL